MDHGYTNSYDTGRSESGPSVMDGEIRKIGRSPVVRVESATPILRELGVKRLPPLITTIRRPDVASVPR